jgi:hypothetical protein
VGIVYGRENAPIDKLHSRLALLKNPKYGDEGNLSRNLHGEQFCFVISLIHIVIFKAKAFSVKNLNTQKCVKTQSDALAKFAIKG